MLFPVLFTKDDKPPFLAPAHSGLGERPMSKVSTQPQQRQSQAPAGASKLKKIEWYAGQLIDDAVSKEKSGSVAEAIVHYLNAADVLMLLGKSQDNYTVWKSYTDKALQCQQRAKALMATRRTED